MSFNTTLQRNANRSDAMLGAYPSGDAPELSADLEYTLAIPVDAIWVESGYVGTETGTEAQPYSTLRLALDATTNGAGAHIVIKDATIAVTAANRTDWMINDRAGDGFSAINSGASWASSNADRSNMITIRAETAYGVRMSYTGAGGYYRSFVQLENAEYVSVDGFIFEYDETSGNALLNGVSAYDNNYISRCIVKRAKDGQAGSWFACGDYSLIEMCAGVGGTRYGFRSGDSTAATTNHCFRLCIGRQDFSEWSVPCSTFAHYGNNTGNLSKDAAFLNCMAIDGQWYDTGNSNLIRWSSLYLPKNATDIIIKGFVSLNEDANYAGIFAGEQQSQNVDISDSVTWDAGGGTSVSGWRNNASAATGHSADALTLGNVTGDFEYASNIISATNTRSNDALNGTDKTILYQSDGADARYVFGTLGQRYGDTDFDTKSAVPVFPYPYEATLKTVFSEQVDTPTGSTPASNVSARGFAADTSLTEYLLTYVDGTATIGDLY